MSWLIPPLIKKESKWNFKTFGTSGGGMGVVASSSGTIILDDPKGRSVAFGYLGVGGGLSAGIKVGKFQVELPVSATLGPLQFPSQGRLFVLDNVEKDELSQSDIQGPCAFFEAGAGLVVGVSGTVMYVGLNPWFIPFLLVNPQSIQAFINSAKGLLFMEGINEGFQAGGSIAALVGYLH